MSFFRGAPSSVAGWDRVFRLTVGIALLYFGGFVFGSSPPGNSDGSSTFTYHSAVSEVRLTLIATDEHNRPVENLGKEDFAIVDDERVIRTFRSFAIPAEVRLDVVVLVDSSGSVTPRFQEEIGEVRQLISQWPWSAGDELSVISVSGVEAQVVCARNCGRSSFSADAMAALPLGGVTPLFDSVFSAARALGEHRQSDVWTLIILFSDGGDTISRHSLRDTLDSVLAGGVQVYAVDTGAQPSSGTAILQRLADDSGGRRLPLAEGAAGILHDILSDLHSARVVTYALPVSASDFHSVRILPTHNLKLQFRCRSGYYQHSYGPH